ncbi:hypothetical protein [Solemya velum gill symbiont]|uniref:hypothetical protein n=1 Tax=Solemya velum gill symbiont TaxID=2340 RepID=UPI000998B859|nr:hypothetical protein [Solemya velum gill symbiont]OOZ47042.1 hypothetical protein BOW38_04265 [Solemya velum gill symbiont]OOZ52142.1 hypothetical protein BOW40_03590 [Solemya velum gill symbiont]OOZ54993.1 hypothetical protein BOW41_04795 [Solemya velum gill symbiont]OOZ56658.1 hypothetical protein BOW42_06050 [Solemya velum gill symbiont]OOZ61145.1 hypothetical protein BOW43_00550 [Solemya velum gill symbiont]
MGGVFYLIGIVLAGYAGYTGLDWYFIFISSIIMAVGYFIIRASQIRGIISDDGAVAFPKLLFIQVVTYSIVTAPVYFIAAALG